MNKIIFIFFCYLFSACKQYTCKDYEVSSKKLHYDIFVEYKSSSGRRFEIKGQDLLGNTAKYEGVSGMYIPIIDSLSIGDRIKKDTGSLVVTIYKNNRKVYFFYEGCDKDGEKLKFRPCEVEYNK